MAEYRYVVNGKIGMWKSLNKITMAMLVYIADAMNEHFKNWYMEFR